MAHERHDRRLQGERFVEFAGERHHPLIVESSPFPITPSNTLEPPQADEHALTLPITASTEDLVAQVLSHLETTPA